MTTARITDEDRIVVLAVENVPDMKSPYHRSIIAPSRLTITYRWRETAGLYSTGADVSGPRRLKSGALGQLVDVGYLSPGQRPDWVNELVAQHAPADWPQP